MKKIILVTVNYNTEKDTRNLLDSLEKINKSDFEFEKIVVDNGSSKKFIKSNKDNFKLIRSEKNLGFSAGYNLGIANALVAGADYVLIANNDTIVFENMVRDLFRSLDNTNYSIAVPKIYFAKGHEFFKEKYQKDDLGKVIWFAGGYIDWRNIKSVHRGVDEVDQGQYDNQEEVNFATGCCMLIKKKVFEDTVFFDDKYFFYYEDADFCVRAKEKNHKIIYVPKARIYHINASSSGGVGGAMQDYFLTRNQMLFGMKHAPLRSKIALIKQSFKILLNGRKYQKKGIIDFYLGRLGKGTYA